MLYLCSGTNQRNTVAPPPAVTHAGIHFAKVFPVRRTTCGSLGPSSSDWFAVTCDGCLRVGSGLCQAARDRVAQLTSEAEERERMTT